MANRATVENYDIAQLERLLFFYPWYSYARVKLVQRLAGGDSEAAEQKAVEESAYYPSLSPIYRALQEEAEKEAGIEEGGAEEAEIIDFETISPPPKEGGPQYIMAGADYFSPEELRSVEQSELKSTRSAPLPEFDLQEFYTETLARIYAGQGYYDEAIKVYAKLILLYPEKSAYFAALAEEIKSKKS